MMKGEKKRNMEGKECGFVCVCCQRSEIPRKLVKNMLHLKDNC